MPIDELVQWKRVRRANQQISREECCHKGVRLFIICCIWLALCGLCVAVLSHAACRCYGNMLRSIIRKRQQQQQQSKNIASSFIRASLYSQLILIMQEEQCCRSNQNNYKNNNSERKKTNSNCMKNGERLRLTARRKHNRRQATIYKRVVLLINL